MSAEAGQSKQHPGIAMPAKQGDFRHGHPKFKESTNSFMPQVVEMKILYARSLDEPFPREAKGIGGHLKYPL